MSEPAPKASRWLLGGCGVLFALAVGGGFVVAWWAGQVTRTIDDVVHKHLEAMVKGDWQAAYGLMSEEFRKETSLEQFSAQWGKHPYLMREPTFSPSSQLAYESAKGLVLQGRLSFHDPGTAGAQYGLVLGAKPEDDRIHWFDWK